VDYKNDLHTLPGIAKVNFERVCEALAEIDYAGDFTMEITYFFRGFPDALKPAAARLAAEVGKYWAERVEAYKKEIATK
jgi:sugar phosphate isomerase/epimerase